MLFFTRRLADAQDLHLRIKDQDLVPIAEQAKAVGVSDLTLLDLMLAGPKLKPFPSSHHYLQFRSQVLLDLQNGIPDLPNVSRYRVFPFIDITALKAGYDWAKGQDLTQLTNPNIKSWELERLSLSCDKPSILLSIKYLWLYRGFRNFRGTLANTSPVCKSLKFLYGTDFGSGYKSTWAQVELSAQIGHPEIDPWMVNTILWLMGQTF